MLGWALNLGFAAGPGSPLEPNKVYWIIKFGWFGALLAYGVFV